MFLFGSWFGGGGGGLRRGYKTQSQELGKEIICEV